MELVGRLLREVFTAPGAFWRRPGFWLVAGAVVLPFGVLLLALRLWAARTRMPRLLRSLARTTTWAHRQLRPRPTARLGLAYHLVVAAGVTLALLLATTAGHSAASMLGLYAGGFVTAAAIALRVVRRMGHRLRRLAATALKLQREAHHDSLTGLPNRTRFDALLDRSIGAARANGERLGLLLLDLDRFKDINDSLGHVHGDVLLTELAPRLRSAVRENDTVARLGGDEFAVLLPGVADLRDCAGVALRLREAIQGAFEIADHAVHVSASVGVALFPDHAVDAQAMLQRADVAMYAAKGSARGVVLYEDSMQRQSARWLALQASLRHAMATGTPSLEYQPTLALRTGRITAVEALVRYTDPQHGPIGPDELIAVAERMDATLPLTLWGLEAAVTQLRRWRDVGLEVGLAMDVPARVLQDRRFPQCVAEILRRSGTPACRLTLGITERGLTASPEAAVDVLVRLGALGVTLSLDHFGSEASSLTHLSELPVHEVKLSGAFVPRMLADERTSAVLESLIGLARRLGLTVTAEGVETQAICEALSGLGCDRVQGDYISPPSAAADLEHWLAAAPRAWESRSGSSSFPREARGHALTR